MKIVILTSDIIDGLIISERIVFEGRDVRAIFYEKKEKTLKKLIKRILYKILGKLKNISYEGMGTLCPEGIHPVIDMNDPEVKRKLEEIGPELIVVIGTGKLKKEIFALASFGAINMHSGILPYYRGADSEFWALYNEEKDKIGVTVHFIDEGLDTGDIILTARQGVLNSDDHKSLRMRNIFLGAEKILEAVELIEKGANVRIPQDNSKARVYKSATSEDLEKLKMKCNG